MNKKRIVVVDSSKEDVKKIKEYFKNSDSYNVSKTFETGTDALDYLINNHYEYELIVIDLLLPGVDGISVLEDLRRNKIDKKVIVYSSYKNNIICNKLIDLNVGYCLLKPVNVECLEERINDLFNCCDEIFEKSGAIQLEISKLLLNLGVPTHLRGYKYLRESIIEIYNSTDEVFYITKDIYPLIAEKFDTTPDRVERAIRHAIDICWSRGDITLFDQVFGYTIDYERGKPTNYEFISTVSDRLKLNLNVLK